MAPPPPRGRRPGRWFPWLVLVALPLLVWEAWTVVAWLADGPHLTIPLDAERTSNWYATRAWEAGILLVSGAVVVAVVRGCLRERRVLTFDVMFCAAAATATWATIPGPNFFEPMLRMSSNWAHVNPMCGNMPFIPNRQCGAGPDPFVFWLMWAFGMLGFAMAGEAGLRWLRRRRPGLSRRRQVGVVLAAGVAADLALELHAVALGAWTFRPGPLTLSLGGGRRFPLVEVVAGTVFLAAPVLLRAFRDDSGRTIIERATAPLAPRRRQAATFLALFLAFQAVAWLGLGIPLWSFGPHADAWPALPSYLAR